MHSSHDVDELFFDVLLGALFAACEPAAQTFGNTARKECRHDLRGSWHTVAAGLNLLELLADVRHHLLGHDVEQQYKAVRPDRGADQLLVRFCKFKYIIQHLIIESHRVIRRAVPPDAFVLVIDDLFYNECLQLVFIGETLIEGRLPDHRPVAQLFDLDVLKGHLLHHFNQCLCHGHIRKEFHPVL